MFARAEELITTNENLFSIKNSTSKRRGRAHIEDALVRHAAHQHQAEQKAENVWYSSQHFAANLHASRNLPDEGEHGSLCKHLTHSTLQKIPGMMKLGTIFL
jgi:hypothetical protein